MGQHRSTGHSCGAGLGRSALATMSVYSDALRLVPLAFKPGGGTLCAADHGAVECTQVTRQANSHEPMHCGVGVEELTEAV